MKRFLIIGILAILIVGSIAVTADAKKKKPRRVERQATATYDVPALGLDLVFVYTCVRPNAGCVTFLAGHKERFVSLEIKDTAGQAVVGVPEIDGVPSPTFCGSTVEPLFITPGSKVTVFVPIASSPTVGACPGVATTGTVAATFSNIP